MQSEKAQVQEVGGHAADDQKQISPNFQHVNKPSWISPNKVLQ